MSDLFRYGVDGGEVTPIAVVVQSIAHDEIVGDIEASVVDGERHTDLLGLDEQRSHVQVSRVELAELGEQLLHGQSGVDEVFHHDHRAPFQTFGESDEFFHLARALHAGIT